MNVEKKLASDILGMMAANFDRWEPGGDVETVKAVVHSAHLVAQGIARKLTGAMSKIPGELNEQRWQQLVEEATVDAFIEVTDGGPLVKLGQTPGFAATVADCTARTVAPPGSDWALAVDAREERRERVYLEEMGLPPNKIEELIQQRRSLQLSLQQQLDRLP